MPMQCRIADSALSYVDACDCKAAFLIDQSQTFKTHGRWAEMIVVVAVVVAFSHACHMCCVVVWFTVSQNPLLQDLPPSAPLADM